MRRRSAVLALLVPVLALAPRAADAQSRVLDEYVTIGLAQNLSLRQQSLASDRSDAVVREAVAPVLL